MRVRCTCNNHLSKETKKETRSKFIEIDQVAQSKLYWQIYKGPERQISEEHGR